MTEQLFLVDPITNDIVALVDRDPLLEAFSSLRASELISEIMDEFWNTVFLRTLEIMDEYDRTH